MDEESLFSLSYGLLKNMSDSELASVKSFGRGVIDYHQGLELKDGVQNLVVTVATLGGGTLAKALASAAGQVFSNLTSENDQANFDAVDRAESISDLADSILKDRGRDYLFAYSPSPSRDLAINFNGRLGDDGLGAPVTLDQVRREVTMARIDATTRATAQNAAADSRLATLAHEQEVLEAEAARKAAEAEAARMLEAATSPCGRSSGVTGRGYLAISTCTIARHSFPCIWVSSGDKMVRALSRNANAFRQ